MRSKSPAETPKCEAVPAGWAAAPGNLSSSSHRSHQCPLDLPVALAEMGAPSQSRPTRPGCSEEQRCTDLYEGSGWARGSCPSLGSRGLGEHRHVRVGSCCHSACFSSEKRIVHNLFVARLPAGYITQRQQWQRTSTSIQRGLKMKV